MQADKLRAIVAFLCGEAELDGRWYGDTDNVPLVAGKYPARYWWRSQLRKEVDELLANAEAAEDLRADAMRYKVCRLMLAAIGKDRIDFRGLTPEKLDAMIDAKIAAAALSTVAPVRD